MAASGPAVIGVIGASWRAGYYLRAARELPGRFAVATVLVRSAASAARVTERWGVAATTSIDEFLAAARYDYVVVSVPPDSAAELTRAVIAAGVPVLSETPPAPDVESLFELYRAVGGAPVQVAEQYRFQAHHAARLSVAASGLIGDIGSVRLSVAHGYHGVSLMRFALGVGFEPAEVSAQAIVDRVVSARGRDEWNAEPVEYDAGRTISFLRFGARTGIYDFDFEQYFSPIRSRHVDVYGTSGEINDDRVSWLTGPGHAAHATLHRESTGVDGDLEGWFLHRIALGADVHYENRFVPARLNDDELAVAEVMARMTTYVRDGEPFYGLADASQDQYLSLLINRSAETGESLRTGDTPWADAPSVAARG
jgi:predicted dehydrogenase